MQEDLSSTPPAASDCPSWADTLIRQIHLLEVRMGNLVDPKDQWKSADVDEALKRFLKEDAEDSDDEAQVEALFRRIVRGLVAEGHQPAQISTWINDRVGFGGRLPYCNESEVRAALDS